ncbi:MAG: hypothetical protein VX733_14445 [Candidatus Latescibacterota bacterium]|nr:hypothetical protein [Candidatus Latescibacterota bacterium]
MTAQNGYRLTRREVVVDRLDHWVAWQFAPGTVEISPQGHLQPHRLQRRTNSVTDILAFLRLNVPSYFGGASPDEITLADAVIAGSDESSAVLVLDGDPTTYWEPELADIGVNISAHWWLIVDLGRLVFADRLVVDFVDEELGDPLLLFTVLVSDGLKPPGITSGRGQAFRKVFQTLQENTTQRHFEIDLTGLNAEVKAEGVRFVQIIATGSRGERGRQVSREVFEALPSAEQGAVEHYKRLPDGDEFLVSPDTYAQLDEASHADIRYFRDERARLADIEVWAAGDEILSGTLKRGGFADAGVQSLGLSSYIDGDLESFSRAQTAINTLAADPRREILFDMGAHFWVDSHRMAYSGSKSSFRSYSLEFSDGSLAADGSLQWTRSVEREQLQRSGVRFEGNSFDPVAARFFRITWQVIVGGGAADLAELQLYGAGFQPRVSLISDLIRLGGRRNLLTIEWDADTPPGTKVLLQTRTGNELEQLWRFFHKNGQEVTEDAYRKLLSIFRGDSLAVQISGGDWSDWSQPYAVPGGSAFASPSPRKFLTLRAVLVSDDADTAATLRSVKMRFGEPVAERVVAEVFPFKVDSLGVPIRLSLYLRPTFSADDPGFDEILIKAPSDMELRFDALYAGGEEEFVADVDLNRLRVAQATAIASDSDSLQVQFPTLERSSDVEVLRLDFETALFATGALLSIAVQNGATSNGAWQRVDAGDALPAAPGNTTTLVSRVGTRRVLQAVRVQPPVFSPNADGINDEAIFQFQVLRSGDDRGVRIDMFDLGGARVRVIEESREVSTGNYALSWDGRDDDGRLMPPGLYVARIRIGSSTDGAATTRDAVLETIVVAY